MATKYQLMRDVSGAVTTEITPSDTVVNINVVNVQEYFDIPAEKAAYIVIFKYVSNTSDASANRILVEARNYPYPPNPDVKKENPLAFSVSGGARIYLNPARIGIDTDVLVSASIYEVSEAPSPINLAEDIVLQSIYIEPIGSTKGVIEDTLTFKAWGVFSDGSSEDVTSACNWISADTYVAQSNGPGSYICLHAGTSDVQAEHISTGFRSNFITIKVVSISYINVIPASATNIIGGETQFSAFAYYSDNTSSSIIPDSWESSDLNVAIINNNGKATGIDYGLANIYCVYKSIPSYISTLTIADVQTIRLIPESMHIGIGETKYLTAVGYFSNGDSTIITPDSWTSSYPNIASVDNTGVVTGIASGSCIIYCTYQAISSAPCGIKVYAIDYIVSNPTSITLKIGETYSLQAIAYYTDGSAAVITPDSWTSNNTGVVTVNSSGLLTPVSGGSTVVYCTYSGIDSSDTSVEIQADEISSIEITPQHVVVTAGGYAQFTAIATYADGRKEEIIPDSWSSSNPNIVSIDANGYARGVALGVIAVTASISSMAKMKKGILADGIEPRDVSAETDVVVGWDYLSSIEITPSDNTYIVIGDPYQYSCIATFLDGSRWPITPTSWVPSNGNVFSIDDKGCAIGFAQGTDNLTAYIEQPNGPTVISPPIKVNVIEIPPQFKSIASLRITPDNAVIQYGQSVQLIVNAVYNDGSNADIIPDSWAVGAPAVLSITNTGVATGLSLGLSTLSATVGAITSPDVNIRVGYANQGKIVSIKALPESVLLLKDSSGAVNVQQMTCLATFEDGTRGYIAPTRWEVVASGLEGNVSLNTDTGQLTGSGMGILGAVEAYVEQPGLAAISSQGVTVSVLAIYVQSIHIYPQPPSLNIGDVFQMNAAYHTSDGETSLWITSSWISSNPSVASIDGYGTLTCHSAGTTQIHNTFFDWYGTINSNYITVEVEAIKREIPVGLTVFTEDVSLDGFLPNTGYTFCVTNPKYTELYSYLKRVNQINNSVPLYGLGDGATAQLDGLYANGIDVFHNKPGTPSGTTKFSLLSAPNFWVDVSGEPLGCIIFVSDATDIVANPKAYLRYYTPTSDWYLVFSINGVIQMSTDIPVGATNYGVIYITSGMTMSQVRLAFLAALNPLCAATADDRGLFYRITDNGAGKDPNASTRTLYDGTIVGDHPGTFEGEAFASHNHILAPLAIAGKLSDMGSGQIAPKMIYRNGSSVDVASDCGWSFGTEISSTGGLENRPINKALNSFIKY